MKRLVVSGLVTLEGVVDAPEGWQPPHIGDEMLGAMGRRYLASDVLVLGRETCRSFVNQINGMPEHVVATTRSDSARSIRRRSARACRTSPTGGSGVRDRRGDGAGDLAAGRGAIRPLVAGRSTSIWKFL